MNNIFKQSMLGSALLLCAAGAQADIAPLVESCNACHGAQGVSQHTDIPTIAGLAQSNLADQMRAYLDGRPAKTVNHVSGDTSKKGNMTEAVKALSEEQIDALAEHYSALPFKALAQPFDAALAATGKALHESADCKKCHTEGGSLAEDEASILAGQPKGYLLTTLDQIKAGELSYDEKMDKAIKAMSEADLKALAEYYASQQ
ncbi:MAG: c-type cytochrome [Aeromonas sp.]